MLVYLVYFLYRASLYSIQSLRKEYNMYYISKNYVIVRYTQSEKEALEWKAKGYTIYYKPKVEYSMKPIEV